MDVVRTSVAGAVAACSALMLLSTVGPGHAGPPLIPTPTSDPLVDPPTTQSPPAPPAVRVSPFSLSGPVLAPPPSAPASVYGVSRRPLPRFPGAPLTQWDALIEEAALRFSLPPSWVRGVMRMESGGQTMLNGRPITSSAGAMGLMQVMPQTFAEMTRRYGLGNDPYEPRANILAGAAFLREMYDRYGPAHFLAAYNSGPGRVDDHLRSGRPLPFETRRYVEVLGPRLLGDTGNRTNWTSLPMQDLTSADAMRRAVLPPFRRLPSIPPRPEAAPLFAAANVGPSPRARQDAGPASDALFVRLVGQDQRRAEQHDDTPEN